MSLTEPTTRPSRELDRRDLAWRRLIAGGLSAEEAGSWCDTWEAEANRHELRGDSQDFWDAGRGWIDAQRSFRKGLQ